MTQLITNQEVIVEADPDSLVNSKDPKLREIFHILFDNLNDPTETYLFKTIPFEDDAIQWIKLEEHLVRHIGLTGGQKLAKVLKSFPQFSPVRAVKFMRNRLESNTALSSTEIQDASFHLLAHLESQEEIAEHIKPIAKAVVVFREYDISRPQFWQLREAFSQLLSDEFVLELRTGVTL